MKLIMSIVLVAILSGCGSEPPPITPEAKAQIRENGAVLDREMEYREKTRQANARAQEQLLQEEQEKNASPSDPT